jgi:DNA-binding LytR/AlgR family response regulator
MTASWLGALDEVAGAASEMQNVQVERLSSKQNSNPLITALPEPEHVSDLNDPDAFPGSQGDAAWKPERVAFKTKGHFHLVEPKEILAVEAQGNYVLLQESRGSHLLRIQIAIVADQLLPFGIIRVSRSLLVNVAHVMFLEPVVTGQCLLRMRGGKVYRATRTYRNNLRLIAASWIGANI